jgi:hypothetical protein
MATFVKRLSGATLAGAAACVLAASPALAQQGQPAAPPAGQPAAPAGQPAAPAGQPAQGGQGLGRGGSQSPYGMGNFGSGFQPYTGPGSPYAYLSGLSGSGVGAMTSVNPQGSGAPYYQGSPGLDLSYLKDYPPYMSPYYISYPDPYGGGLRGAAAAIDAQGRFDVMWQQSRLLGQEVERSKIDTRRKIYDEWLYEQATKPTVEDIRERSQAMELRRILHDAPLTDVVSGYALNTLLDNLAVRPNYARGPQITLDPSLLKQVNVTSRENGGNIGVLKSIKEGAPLPWPLPLQAAIYREKTRRLNRLAAEAVNMAQNGGPVAPGTLNDMIEDVRTLRDMVRANVNDLTPSQSVEAKRFLSQLDDAILALKQQNVGNYFTDKWAARGKTVADLVAYMISNGLKFAPAVSGDETAYASLYNALMAYRNGLESEVVRDGGK